MQKTHALRGRHTRAACPRVRPKDTANARYRRRGIEVYFFVKTQALALMLRQVKRGWFSVVGISYRHCANRKTRRKIKKLQGEWQPVGECRNRFIS